MKAHPDAKAATMVDLNRAIECGGIPPEFRGRLAIAPRAVDDCCRGTLTFETELRKGTTFTVRIPATANVKEVA